MRATLTARQLRDILAPACDVVPKRNTIPALSFIKLEVDTTGKWLRLTAHDIDTVLSLRTAVSGESGAVLAPCHALHRIIRAVAGDEFVTLTDKDDRLIIDFRDARFSLLTIPVKDFSDITWTAGSYASGSFTTPAGWMQDVLGKAEPFISTEETRYYLNGVCLHVLDKGLAVVATDGHRLARVISDIECEAALGNAKIILPRYAVRFLVKHAKATTVINFSKEKRVMHFDAQGMKYATKLIDGTYPDYQRVMPQGESTYTLAVGSDKLLATLRRLTSYGAKTLTFALSGKRLIACSKGADLGGASIVVPGVTNGIQEPISLNASYLQTICRAARCKPINIAFRSAGEPILIKEGRDLYVQMPMRGGSTGFVELPAGCAAA